MNGSYFDASNWNKYAVQYIFLLIIVIIIIFIIFSSQGEELRGGHNERPKSDGNGEIFYLGRGSENDSVATLVDRIEWAAYLEKRTTYWQRVIVMTFVITLLIILLVMRGLPKPGAIVLMFFVIFIPIYAVHQLFYVHGDVYNDYYIKTNAELLRDKLNLDRNEPPPPADNIPDRPFVMNPK